MVTKPVVAVTVVLTARLDTDKVDLKSVEQTTNAIYRGVLCLIAIKGGYDFDRNGSIINQKYDKDHIFPRSKFLGHEGINSILNITWLSQETNQLIKRVESPSIFLEKILHRNFDGDEKGLLKTLESHFINYEAYQCMKEDNFDKFIEEREKAILSAIGEKTGAGAEKPLASMTSPYTPYTNIRRKHNFVAIKIRKLMLKLTLNIKKSQLNDPLHKAREIEGVLSEVRIKEPNEIQYVLPLIQQSYNRSLNR